MARTRPATAAESSAGGRGNALDVTSIRDQGQFFSSSATTPTRCFGRSTVDDGVNYRNRAVRAF